MVLDIFTNTLNRIWPVIAIFLCVLITVRLAYLITNHKKIELYKEVFGLIFVIYILLLFELLTATDTNPYHGVNLKPFTEITRYKFGTRLFNINVFGNILIFIPFGLFISSYLKSKKVFSVLFISIITSTFAELVQLKIGRSFDIDDIILNVVGSIIGYLLYLALKKLKQKLPSCLKKDFIYNILSLLIFAGIIYWLIHRIGII
ncbi:MAG: VanZ family protein [Bacilli bacterium]|nr:VanZ family protein [Bacilli bacterium]